jgi:hypothetical protein
MRTPSSHHPPQLLPLQQVRVGLETTSHEAGLQEELNEESEQYFLRYYHLLVLLSPPTTTTTMIKSRM